MHIEPDANETTIVVDDEDTPYSIRMCAATADGYGPISELFDVTTGKKRMLFRSFKISL